MIPHQPDLPMRYTGPSNYTYEPVVQPDPEAVRVLEQAKANRQHATQLTVADAYFLKGLGIKP